LAVLKQLKTKNCVVQDGAWIHLSSLLGVGCHSHNSVQNSSLVTSTPSAQLLFYYISYLIISFGVISVPSAFNASALGNQAARSFDRSVMGQREFAL
jgi:hypothetical protein